MVYDTLLPEVQQKVHFFSTHFYSKIANLMSTTYQLDKEGYKMVKRWTDGVDLFKKSLIFIPIHEATHWSLAVVVHPGVLSTDSGDESPSAALLFFDSLKLHNYTKCCNVIKGYFKSEWHHHQSQTLDCPDLKMVSSDWSHGKWSDDDITNILC